MTLGDTSRYVGAAAQTELLISKAELGHHSDGAYFRCLYPESRSDIQDPYLRMTGGGRNIDGAVKLRVHI